MVWVSSLGTTFLLILLTIIVALAIGAITAVSAWWSNRLWAYYMPLLILGVPPWLLSYFLSDFGYINPWIGAAVSLGVCCSVYPHVLISSSLANRAFKSWEMLAVVRGKNLTSLLMAVWPSLKISLLPSMAIIAAEVTADWGVSNFYGLNTLTMMTYNIWTSTWNLQQITWGVISLALMGFVISRMDLNSLVAIQTDKHNKFYTRWAVVAVLPTLLLLGFGIFKSVEWITLGAEFHSDDFFKELLNTLYLTGVVVLTCSFISVLYFAGIFKNFLQKSGLWFYSLPGIVIGATMLYLFGSWVSLFVLLTVAIAIRYYGLMINTVAMADKGNQKYFEVIDFYSSGPYQSLIYKIKLMIPSVAMGVCLIILDVVRELPISMILQPMNFQTLAMRMNYIARNENIPMLGPHGLVILVVGIILSVFIIKLIHVTDKKSQF